MAEDVADRLPAAAAARAEAERRRRRHPAFRGRFLAAYLALGVLAGAGVAVAFVLFTQVERSPGSGWAPWHPAGEKATYPRQIGEHVSRRYRLPSGDQLAAVLPSPPEVQDVKVSAVAIRTPNAESSQDIEVLSASKTYMYLLCGGGDQCALDEGTPTEERNRLLRREALELALYTFKYMDGVDSVVALLPPPAGKPEEATALFLQDDFFDKELGRPLAETLGQGGQGLVSVPQDEVVRIDRVTRPFVFTYAFQGLQNQTVGLLLTPITSEQ